MSSSTHKFAVVYAPWRMLIIVAICAFTGSTALAEDSTVTSRQQLRKAYLELLAEFPEDAQGKGVDPEHAADHQPMTYGLVLWSESIRLRKERTDEGARRVRKAARWLIDSKDLDRDGKPGWGLPQAWDAASDGTPNPPNTPYTITTGIVLLGLLEAANVPDFWKPAESEEIRQVVHDTLLRWCREMWIDGYSGGFFRYSPQPSDDLFSVNAPSMVLGALSRYLHDYGAKIPAAERTLMQSRTDTFVKTMVATLRPREGRPYWDYMAMPNRFQSERPNDLVHHIYTLWGVEMYRDNGGQVPLPWTREQARESVQWFWKGDRICQYPQDDLRIAKPGNREYPTVLWGAGSLLAFDGHWGTTAEATRCFEVTQKSYGKWPQQRMYPPGFGLKPEDNTVYSRHNAHVLLGLAYAAFGP